MIEFSVKTLVGVKVIGALGATIWGSSVIGGTVMVAMAQDATEFTVSFNDIIALATFITGPPTLVMIAAWRHLLGRIDKVGKRLDDHILKYNKANGLGAKP